MNRGTDAEGVPDEEHRSASGTSRSKRQAKLKAGDLVMVRPLDEIKTTLDESYKCQGLKFLRPMEQYCGKTFRVFKRVRYILDEHEHRMMRLRNTVLLEGVMCEGAGIYGRENCDKSCYFFWKEPWLRKVD